MLQDKVCVITGGSGSIGLATARLFVEQGANVVLVDLSEESLAAAAATLPEGKVILAWYLTAAMPSET